MELQVVEVWREPIPEDKSFDALILLGDGRLHESQQEHDPLWRGERQFLKTWLSLNKPCLAFCLGHQFLADAFHAKVGPNFMTSVGFVEGHLTHDGREHPLFKGIGPTLSLLKWHNQSIQTPVPHNYLLLATSKECVVEAFTIKGRPHIIGLQCDNHAAHPDDISRWLEEESDWLTQEVLQPGHRSKLLELAEKSFANNQEIFSKLISNFVSLVKG